ASPNRRRGRAVSRLPEPAGGGEPRRPGVLRRRRLSRRARHDRRPWRTECADHAGNVMLRPPSRGQKPPPLPRLDPARGAGRVRRRRRRAGRRLPCRPLQQTTVRRGAAPGDRLRRRVGHRAGAGPVRSARGPSPRLERGARRAPADLRLRAAVSRATGARWIASLAGASALLFAVTWSAAARPAQPVLTSFGAWATAGSRIAFVGSVSGRTALWVEP